MTYTPPLQPTAGSAVNQTHTDSWFNGISQLQSNFLALNYSPGSALNTSTTGSAIWFTAATISVPTWATTMYVFWHVHYYMPTPGTVTTMMQMKIGSAVGTPHRLINLSTARQDLSAVDVITGLTSGSQPLTVLGNWISGAALSFTVDAVSNFGALILFS